MGKKIISIKLNSNLIDAITVSISNGDKVQLIRKPRGPQKGLPAVRTIEDSEILEIKPHRITIRHERLSDDVTFYLSEISGIKPTTVRLDRAGTGYRLDLETSRIFQTIIKATLLGKPVQLSWEKDSNILQTQTEIFKIDFQHPIPQVTFWRDKVTSISLQQLTGAELVEDLKLSKQPEPRPRKRLIIGQYLF